MSHGIDNPRREQCGCPECMPDTQAEVAELVKAAEEAALRQVIIGCDGEGYIHRSEIESIIPEGGHLARAIARARREGAEEMRERAAKAADTAWTDVASLGACRMAADCIRALPLDAEPKGRI